ncbi:MAG: hypothetical protein M3Q56_05220 [Bacteroidota bacterium]|nr:hypothetical protein [Bacteroidota bacterium]
MFKKIKNWLGIESVKINFDENIIVTEDSINGQILMRSFNNSLVTEIDIQLTEHYQKGRGKTKQRQDFILGNKLLTGEWIVSKGVSVTIPFTLSFQKIQSKIERMEEKNRFIKPISRLAKLISAVHSDYRLSAAARIRSSSIKAVTNIPLSGNLFS